MAAKGSWVCGLLVVVGCAAEVDAERSAGHLGFEVTRADGARRAAWVWYPTEVDPSGASVGAAFFEGERATTWDGWVEASGGCATGTVGSSREAAPADGSFPLILASHCKGCAGVGLFSAFEALAQAGYVVAAVDHVGDTVWEGDDAAPLNDDTLDQRVLDLEALRDRMRGDDAPVVSAAGTYGLVGHSFGAVTVGALAADDPEVGAVAAVAAPMENPLFSRPRMADIEAPSMFWLAEEDGSITVLGNALIESNVDAAPGGAWRLSVADAGHWSPADLLGLRPAFDAGCGEGPSQTAPGETVAYRDPAATRTLTGASLVAFFDETLGGVDGAIDAGDWPDDTTWRRVDP